MNRVTIALLIFSTLSCSADIVEPKKYLAEVFEKLTAKILAEPGTVLKLKDFESFFYTSLMNHVFNGTAKFHSGLINRIGKLWLNDQKYRNIWNDSVVSKFHLQST